MTEEIRKLDPLTLSLRGSQLIEASAGTGKTGAPLSTPCHPS
jgi:exodeoxyribonuclease V beta subunit